MPQGTQQPTPSSACFSPRAAPPPGQRQSQPPRVLQMWLRCQTPGRRPPLVDPLPAPQLQVQGVQHCQAVLCAHSRAEGFALLCTLQLSGDP